MSSKSVFVNAFYEQIIALITELTQMYPDDKDFFLNYSYDEYSKHIENDIFIKLKHYCQGMTENSMKNVWQYVVNITKLAKICSE